MNEPLFRNLDREALDAEYDNIRKVPEAKLRALRASWAERSQSAREVFDCSLDVPYGVSEGERLDIFRPAGAGPWPIQIYIHGGYWHSNDKRDCSYVAHAFAGSGFLTCIVNYSLAPQVTIARQVEQCRSAVAWIWSKAAELGGDRNRLHVTGHSAGGHLAMMLAATDFRAVAPDLPTQPIASVTSLSGIYDLEPIRLSFLDEKVRLTASDVEQLSPIRLQPCGDVHLLVAVGELEGREYLRQQRDLEHAWRISAREMRALVLPGIDHFTIRAELDDPASSVSRLILDLVERADQFQASQEIANADKR